MGVVDIGAEQEEADYADWMLLSEASELTGFSSERLRQFAVKGVLKTRRLGKFWFVSRAEMQGVKREPSIDRAEGRGKRFLVLQRDQFTCQYCGRSAPSVELHVDHRIPKAKGGTNESSNLVTACRDCNLGKRDVLLPEIMEAPIVRPFMSSGKSGPYTDQEQEP